MDLAPARAILAELEKRVNVAKTQAFYDRALRAAVWDFYRGDTDAFGFIAKMVYLITEQFTRAWNEGMRSVDLDPKEDMEPDWQAVLDDRIEQEVNAVEKFAGDIETAAADKENNPPGPLLARVSMWSNRYNEIVSLSVATCGRQKLEWVLGPTEHCDTCLRLSGCVDWSENWAESGWLPQTNMLACGGFKCQCKLEPTKKRRTPGGVFELMDGYGVG